MSDGFRFFVEVVTTAGPAAQLEIRVKDQTVELWRGATCSAVFDRGHLRTWMDALNDTTPPPACGDVHFHLDRQVDQDGRVAITMPDVNAWTFSPRAHNDLRGQL